VVEREVDGARQRARLAQLAQFVTLSLPAGHGVTMRPRPDPSLTAV
jgi:hypothetical protein